MNRREFLASSAIAAGAAAIGGRSRTLAWAQQPAPGPVAVFTPIRRGVGYFTYSGGTIGFLVNDAGVLAIDSQYLEGGKRFVEGIGQRSGGRPIDALINTHHHADHTGGNIAFKGVAKHVVAHAQAVVLQKQVADAAEEAAKTKPPTQPLVEQLYADLTFTTSWKTTIGDETITAAAYTPAHTGGDAIVYFEKANVVHAGDLVWNRIQTFVDRAGGASALHWIPMLEQIAAKYPADAIYIFGHGAKSQVTGSRAEVTMMRDYMTALVEFVRGEIKAGKPRDEVIKPTATLKGFEDFGTLTARAVTGTFDELTAK